MGTNYQPKVGDICRTPYEPNGIVQILEIGHDVWQNDEFATVLYLHAHYGYAAGTLGSYPVHELLELGELTEIDSMRLEDAKKHAERLTKGVQAAQSIALSREYRRRGIK